MNLLHLPFGAFLENVRQLIVHSTVDLPPDAWWMPAIVIFVLGCAAAVDAFSGTVPDIMVFGGLAGVTLIQGEFASWDYAAHHLEWAIGFGVVIWLVNEAWYYAFNYDAIGMGDAKWSMLAVACFDIKPMLAAWGVGAVLGLACLGILFLSRYKITRVHLTPFLFIGLMAALWLRANGLLEIGAI